MLTRLRASGRPASPASVSGSGSGSVRALRILSAMASASSVRLIRLMSEGSDFDIFFVPSRKRHHPRRRALDHRLGQREEVDAVVVVELGRDVAGELDVLLLVLAHRHVGGVVEQDVGRHQRRIGESPSEEFSGFLPALSLNWVIRFSQPMPGDAVEDPGELGVRRHLGLVEEDRALRVEAAGDVGRGQLAGGLAQLLRVLPDGDRVQVDDAVDRLMAVLHRAQAAERAEIVAERQVARRLDAGKDAGAELGARP